MAPQFNRVSDLTILVERPGSQNGKPPVLLIHGMFGGAWYWEKYQGYLAQSGYESHAINLRGHHDSRPVQDIGKVSLEDYVADALEVAATLKNPIVMGHSMGGLIAQKIAEAGKCCATVLVASAPPRWIPLANWLLLKKQVRHARALILSEALLPDRKDADILLFNRMLQPDRDQFFARMAPESGRAGLQLSFGAIAVQESRVTAPMLVMTGLDDKFVVPRVARAIARKYGAELREYPGFAHNIITEPGWEGPCADAVAWLDREAHG
jgi:pimeloyl-ACP methyl ester carboxylesterase